MHSFSVLFTVCSALEHFARKYPQYIDLKKDDGYTALHLAALNDNLDALTALLDMVINIIKKYS